jgi:hypothetical protein
VTTTASRPTVGAKGAKKQKAVALSSGVQYRILTSDGEPFLLARVRWPDIAEALSKGRPVWQSDPGLFDLPYEPSSTAISETEADALTEEWGATAASDVTPSGAPPVMRRMPPNWSDLSPAERRLWHLELVPAEPRPVRRRVDLGVRVRALFGRWPRTATLQLAGGGELDAGHEGAGDEASEGAVLP